jgi:hypothetical protein
MVVSHHLKTQDLVVNPGHERPDFCAAATLSHPVLVFRRLKRQPREKRSPCWSWRIFCQTGFAIAASYIDMTGFC